MTRAYHDGCASEIASDVLWIGKSTGWFLKDMSSLETAVATEAELAQHSIGYVDDLYGTWAYAEKGTRFFASMLPVQCKQ